MVVSVTVQRVGLVVVYSVIRSNCHYNIVADNYVLVVMSVLDVFVKTVILMLMSH